ncbi:LacI family DNA-binding transcriptional regulator [Sphingobacterium litopenaei]|uniref:LacI family DNA-binding transcriptional regulator n=1 Tax=Sphingobacterium litopenaei TaxID=2763500 RepID=A0ABR7YBW5_9SPHI|nr:LacI family DNA-binding transcriptional regulator [Sphingobacterium litopenaei]MBD1428791.1 LacI family DNA-binding transcriptional regulator [Sphingobacterium litopenaei]
MSFQKYTLKDIAKALNLSTSTVSRALRDSYEISEETKKKVLSYAQKINFQVNPIARSLKERRSNTIGVIVSEISNNFFSQVIEGIESVAYDRNYQVVITQSHENNKREKLLVEHLFKRSIDGLLMTLSAESNETEYLEDLVKSGFPLVFFDRVPETFDAHKVIADNKKGGVEAVEYLVRKGCRRIAHITGNHNLSTNRERLDGFKKGLKANGFPFEEEAVRYCPHGGADAGEMERAVQELESYGYDGIFISGDRLTTGYLQALNRLGDLENKTHRIVGFTNSKVFEIFNPPITAIKQPAIEMGEKAAKLLIAQIEAKYPMEEYETIMLPIEMASK